jgi:uncharacterized RDD family membrane protein YckC
VNVTIDGKAIAPRVAPIWRRLAALAIDFVVSGLLTGIPSLAVVLFLQSLPDAVLEVVSVAVGFLVFAAYQGLMPVVTNGRTAGMYPCGIRIVDAATSGVPSSDRLAIRAIALSLSLLAARFVMGAGPAQITGPVAIAALLFPLLLRDDRRALHDLVAGTRVVLDPA